MSTAAPKPSLAPVSSLDPLDRVRRAHVAIIRHRNWCRFAGILSYGETRIGNCPTAQTDGKHVTYNPEFIASLTEPQLRFVVLHEAMHKAFRHLTMWRPLMQENAELANVAMDYFINTTLVHENANDSFLAMPPIGVPSEPKYLGWNVKRIYDDLKQQQQQQPQQPQQGGGKGSGNDKSKGKGKPELPQPHDSHDWEAAKEHAPDEAAAEQQAKEIAEALRQGEAMARKRGDGSGDRNALFDEVLQPQVDWREQLRDFATQAMSTRDESSWRRPHRRYLADDVYMPSYFGVSIDDAVIGFDTSGSCFGTATMTRFVSELQGIVAAVQPKRVHVICWDTSVVSHQLFEGATFAVADLKPKGGGGTRGDVLFDYLREKGITPACIIQFTDGYVGAWGHTSTPTLWAITTDHINAPFGTTIHIKE